MKMISTSGSNWQNGSLVAAMTTQIYTIAFCGVIKLVLDLRALSTTIIVYSGYLLLKNANKMLT